MSDDIKKRIQQAVEKHSEKLLPKVKKTYGSPEAEVVDQILEYLREHGCSVQVYESKSTYSESQQQYVSQSLAPGHPDIAGNFSNGLAIFIEAKAPKKLRTIRPNQREFLIEKISTNCFAACVDSLELLKTHINEFKKSDNRKKYLLSVLPEPYNSKKYQDDESGELF